MTFHENRLPADDSHEISCLISYFRKKEQISKLSSAANYRWRFKGKKIFWNKLEQCFPVMHGYFQRKLTKSI